MTIQPSASSYDDKDNIQFVRPMAKKHPQRTSIQHWQLRDLLHAPINKQFVHVSTNNVYQYDTTTKQNTAILKDLSFSPTSVTCGFGYVAAGGQRSQLMVKQLHGGSWSANSSVGGSINNSLCFSACPWGSYAAATSSGAGLPLLATPAGDHRLLICNNDETIKVYSIPGMQRVTTIGLPTAVNYASVSPDGRKLCAVGDSNQVFLFDITASGHYQRFATLTGSTDAGFSCAWNHSSDKLAVGAQDGVVSVWDVRNMSTSSTAAPSAAGYRKLAHIKSSQHPQVKGAVRAVKFSPSSSIDLLVFTEHVSYVNFVDARTFDQSTTARQSIRLSGGSQGNIGNAANVFSNEVHLSGLTFAPDSRSVFVGLETMVLEFDVDTIARRSFPVGAII